MLNVDLRGIPPSLALTPVPDGWYKVRIVKSNLKQTSKGDGGYLELIHEIIEGPFQGRLLYWNLNLFNPNQTTVEIAYKQLSAIGHCIGVFNVQGQQNSPDAYAPMFHNIPYQVWAVIAQGNQGPINNIRGCKDINGNDPGQQGRGPAQPMPAAAPGWQQGGQPGAPGGGNAPAGYAAPAGQTWQQPGFTPPTGAPQQPAWQANPAPNQPMNSQPAAPAWQPGTNTPPQQWQQPTNQPQQPPQQPTWQQGGQPTTAAPQPGPAPTWQQGNPPASAPWSRQ